MLFHFVSPNPDGTALVIPIEGEDFPAAFRIYALNHWDIDRHAAFGVWQGPQLIAKVFTGIILASKSISPVYQWIEPQSLPQGVAKPGEN